MRETLLRKIAGAILYEGKRELEGNGNFFMVGGVVVVVASAIAWHGWIVFISILQ